MAIQATLVTGDYRSRATGCAEEVEPEPEPIVEEPEPVSRIPTTGRGTASSGGGREAR